MFSSAMEVDCCLEEFARVLVANGYIGEDSCFNDADIPSMLNVFETPSALDSPDTFPASPCGYGDLSRALEMAQMASQGLLDSCLSENLAHLKPEPCELYPVKLQHSYNGHSVINDSRSHVKSQHFYNGHSVASNSRPHVTTSYKDSICSRDVFVNNLNGHHINRDISSVSRKQKDIRVTCNTEGSRNLLHHSLSSRLGTNSCQLDLLDQNIHGFDEFPSTQEQQPPLYSEHSVTSSLSSGGHSANSPQSLGSTEVLSSRPKQKRKRRSKGYAKATKAKKRKPKEITESQTQSKPKKLKIPKVKIQEQESVKPEKSSLDDGQDVPQEDSGFESADGKMGNNSGSNVVENLGDVSSNENPESVDNSEPNKCLRRSSRTTRNPENYNFRLSSLVKRVETERRQQEPRQPKDKNKPAPLSKYRRRTANARERDRMKEINDAFDTLRGSLPTILRDDGKNKITKFTILKHALNYIASLRDILGLEAIPSMLDDDISSDFSSIRPGSVASSAAEDSCSSPTSGHSTNNQISSTIFFSDTPSTLDQSPKLELTTQGILLPGSSTL